jgi:hypothetical protein
MNTWHPARQADRRSRFFDLYRRRMATVVDADGGWHGTEREMGFREKAWHCFALLAGGADDVRLANAILRSLEPKPCHFTPMTFLQLLRRHPDRIEPDVRSRMESYVRASLAHAADPRIHVTMYNDNFASLSCFTLIVGGALLGDASALEAGRGKLEGIRDLFRRRGTLMEYGSPTYTPVNTHVFAELATFAPDAVVSELALGCEHRMWAETAAHWHGPSGHLAGPYSRSYWIDTVGHTHLLSGLLWLVFGDDITVNPVADLFPPPAGQVIHIGLETLMLPNIAWLVCGDCHCPDLLARVLIGKRFPAEVSCTSESLPSRIRGRRTWRDGRQELFENPHEYPGFAGPNTAYLAEDYTLAAGYGEYHDGPFTETFYATYRRRRPARRLADTGVVFSRMVFNDKRPEQPNYYSVVDGTSGPEGFRDEGRKWGIQKRSCGLYLYRPKVFECHEVSSLRLAVLFPSHFAEVGEVWLGDRRLDGAEAVGAGSTEPCAAFVRDGPVFFAFRPLALTDLGRRAAVRVERWGSYLAICFYHYEGAARAFTVEEMMLTASGFVAHVGSEREFPDFAAFRAHAGAGVLEDRTEESEGAHTRWVRYRHPDADLQLAISPASEGIVAAAIDGRPRPEPIFAATAIDARRLPFLGRH